MRVSPLVATARSQPCTRWSAASCMTYSSFGVSPKDRCTVPPAGSWAATDSTAALAAADDDPTGSSPSRSPSNLSPTSSMVAPSMSGTVQTSSYATWLTRSRTDQAVHGVGWSHWCSWTASTRSVKNSTVCW